MYIRILSIINVSTSWRTIEICFKSKFCKIPFCEYKIAETINETMFKCKSNLIHVFKTLLVVPYSECLKIPLSCCWSTSFLIIKVINWIWIHGIINVKCEPIVQNLYQHISMKPISLTSLLSKHTFETLCFNFVAKTLKAKCSMNLLTEWKINI